MLARHRAAVRRSQGILGGVDHVCIALVWLFVHLRAQPELGVNLLESCFSWGHDRGSGPLKQTAFGITPVRIAGEAFINKVN
jgi:hypothetical protein